MKNTFKQEKIPLIIIFTVYLITFIATYGCCGDLFIDCGREAYIPFAITQGKLLYKDIFCIYGPFPYLFIAFFYKVFITNLNITYLIGGIFGTLYILGVYFCSREFLSKSISTCISLLIVFSVIFDPSIFNFIFPYSYSMVFAATFSIWIFYFLIKFIQTKNSNYMHYCAILWGAICVSKIDFLPVIIAIGAVFIIFEENKKREFVKFILYTLIVPSVTYLILFTQGVNISDIAKNSYYVSKMMNTDAFFYFYKNLSVLFFSLKNFIENIKNLTFVTIISFLFFSVALFAIRRRNKIIKYGLLGFIIIFTFYIFALQQVMLQMLFATFPYICAIIFIILLSKYLRAKEFRNTKNIIILLLFSFALLSSLKNFHSLLLSFYGAYSFALLLICIIYIINELLKNNAIYNTKKQYELILCIFISIFILLFATQTVQYTITDNMKITTQYGTIKSNNDLGQPFKETLQYINQHAKTNDTIMVLPESIIINFLTGKTSDFYQTSFIPLDFETFSEDNIIKEINAKKPEFIIFTNRKTNEYGKSYICKDYGVDTCKYVVKNYSPEAAFGEKFRIYIFKIKNEEITNEKE